MVDDGLDREPDHGGERAHGRHVERSPQGGRDLAADLAFLQPEKETEAGAGVGDTRIGMGKGA
jgi:hypothetical protein